MYQHHGILPAGKDPADNYQQYLHEVILISYYLPSIQYTYFLIFQYLVCSLPKNDCLRFLYLFSTFIRFSFSAANSSCSSSISLSTIKSFTSSLLEGLISISVSLNWLFRRSTSALVI